MSDCQAELGERVASELMRCQIEVDTPVCTDVASARRELATLRRTIAEANMEPKKSRKPTTAPLVPPIIMPRSAAAAPAT